MDMSGQLYALTTVFPPLSPGNPWYPLNRMLGGPQSQSECFGEGSLGRARNKPQIAIL